MTDAEFATRLRAAGVRHGSWQQHPRPWTLDPLGVKMRDGSWLRAIRDAYGRIVLTDFGVGLDEFWASYLVAMEDQR